jgi:hypothetical protein
MPNTGQEIGDFHHPETTGICTTVIIGKMYVNRVMTLLKHPQASSLTGRLIVLQLHGIQKKGGGSQATQLLE